MRGVVDKQILIIEDDQGVRYMEEKFLGRFFHVVSKPNGREALKWMETNEPDIVITDLDMPEINGIQILKNIRSSLLRKGIHTIVVTGYDDDEFRNICLKYGISAYFVKPFDPMDLANKVCDIINLSSERKQKIRKSLALNQP